MRTPLVVLTFLLALLVAIPAQSSWVYAISFEDVLSKTDLVVRAKAMEKDMAYHEFESHGSMR